MDKDFALGKMMDPQSPAKALQKQRKEKDHLKCLHCKPETAKEAQDHNVYAKYLTAGGAEGDAVDR